MYKKFGDIIRTYWHKKINRFSAKRFDDFADLSADENFNVHFVSR